MPSKSPESPHENCEIDALKNQIKVLQEKLALFEEREKECRAFEVVATHTSNSVLVIDPGGNAKWANPSFERLSGITKQEIIGKTTGQFLMGPETKLDTVQKIWEQMEEKRSFTYEVVHYNQDGEPYQIITNGEPILDAEGQLLGYAMIETDITLLKIMEQTLADAHRATEEKEAAKTNLLANLSHEFRTPINGILGLSELLNTTELDEEQLDYVESIKSSGEVLFQLIQNLLELTNPEYLAENEIEEIDIEEKFSKSINKFLPACQSKKIQFMLNIDPQTPASLKLPWQTIAKILHHLCDNAVKFTPAGKVELCVQNVSPNILEICVIDTGVGIDQEILPHIYDEYFQGDESHTRIYGGIGLGLSLAKKLAKHLDSEIQVETFPDKGSKFSFQVAYSL